MNMIGQELHLLVRDKSVIVWTFFAFLLASFATLSGWMEIKQQQSSIEQLLVLDQAEREEAQEKTVYDWGSHAYYSFHLTYDPPSDFAFASIGQRDTTPWKHRIRALALEGQIYETDVPNPDIALIGRFDFAFLVASLVPLLLITLLHGLRANERSAGRYELLVATSGYSNKLWMIRTGLRSGLVFLGVVLPLILVGAIAGTSPVVLALAVTSVFIYVLFWSAICYWIGSVNQTAPVVLACLTGNWLVISVIVPTASRIAIEGSISLPSQAELIMSQREAVNDAWDLSLEATMTPFIERHPEWTKQAGEFEGKGFDWRWYYAFQQVGDQSVEPLSIAYRKGRLQRDNLAGLVSLFSPPVLIQRHFQHLASTDQKQAIAYEESVRAFHKELRTYYYPSLFLDNTFNPLEIENQPAYIPLQ